ncbi:MAG TPA: class I SAM-dependent methyltransferase [Gemmatimonadales bacterium]|nr:class I SAM-dependent methyltransferase [Gemmatimonadales bacterium]
MSSLWGKVAREMARYYFFVDDHLPHQYVFARNQRRLFAQLPYTDVLSFVHTRYPVKRYLEIGVDAGATLVLSHAEVNVGVDPAFAIKQPLNGRFSLARTTSDRFFDQYAGDPFDLVFVDGMHESRQVSRDVFNALRNLSPNGLVAVHDTVPYHRVVASARRYTSKWTGDVYRAMIPYLECRESNLLTLLVPPTGLTLIRGPRAFLERWGSAPDPPRVAYAEYMERVLPTAKRPDSLQELEGLMTRFHPPGAAG